jgi:hypothetical protein
MIALRLWKRYVFVAAVLTSALTTGPAQAKDQFTIYLRDLQGRPLPGATVTAFAQVNDGTITLPVSDRPFASATVQVGNAIIRLGKPLAPPWVADKDGRIVATLDTINPANRAIVFVASRSENLEQATAVVPFIVDGTDPIPGNPNATPTDTLHVHQLHIAVPQPVAPSPQAPSKSIPAPIYPTPQASPQSYAYLTQRP